jgi:hypothetical protein
MRKDNISMRMVIEDREKYIGLKHLSLSSMRKNTDKFAA